MELMPLEHGALQYVVYWYIAETLPPELEIELETKAGEAYKPPPPYPTGLKLKDRANMEPEGYEPMHHKGTGVDADERTYESHLLPIDDALKKLGTSVMKDVVSKGWKGIQDRYALEESEYVEEPLPLN